jgi:hypothetical protein
MLSRECYLRVRYVLETLQNIHMHKSRPEFLIVCTRFLFRPNLEQLSYMNQAEFNNLEQITKTTLQHYNSATIFDPNWYKVNVNK